MCSRVWSTFEARRSDGSSVKLRIQDLPENRLEDAVQLFVQYNVNEETLLKAAGVPKNPKAVAEYRLLLTESMKDPAFHNVICCEVDDEDNVGQIVGVSTMALVTVGTKDSPLTRIKMETEEMRIYMKLDEASDLHEHMEKLHVFNFYDDIGVVVHPRFRKLGIAMEFAKARRLACIAHNVAATGGMTTSIATEKVATKDNWDTVLEVNLKEFGQHHGLTFEDVTCKLVIWRNPQFKQHNIICK